MGGGAEAEESVGGGREGGGERSPPAMVTFPDAARRNVSSVSPIKLEAEDAADEATPHTLWQVYILGGFLVLRWVWARWKERKDKGRAPDDPSF